MTSTDTYSADDARLLFRSHAGMAAGCSNVARPNRSTHSDLDRSRAAAIEGEHVGGGGAAATLRRRPPCNVDGGGGGNDGCCTWPPSAPPAQPPANRSRDTSFMVTDVDAVDAVDAADDGDDVAAARSSPSPSLPAADDRRRHVREPVLPTAVHETRRDRRDVTDTRGVTPAGRQTTVIRFPAFRS